MPTFKKPFRVLSQEEQDDMIIQTLHAQERDLFMHTVNKERYEELVKTLPEGNELRVKLEKEVAVVASRIEEVEKIIEAIEKQLPSQEGIDSGISRIAEREERGRLQA